MTLYRPKSPNPPAKNGCRCSCHSSLAIARHVMACCPREPVCGECRELARSVRWAGSPPKCLKHREKV